MFKQTYAELARADGCLNIWRAKRPRKPKVFGVLPEEREALFGVLPEEREVLFGVLPEEREALFGVLPEEREALFGVLPERFTQWRKEFAITQNYI